MQYILEKLLNPPISILILNSKQKCSFISLINTIVNAQQPTGRYNIIGNDYITVLK